MSANKPALAHAATAKLCAFMRETKTNPKAQEAFSQCLANGEALIDCDISTGAPVFSLNQSLAAFSTVEVAA